MRYLVRGAHPVVIEGRPYVAGDVYEGEADVAFLVATGACVALDGPADGENDRAEDGAREEA